MYVISRDRRSEGLRTRIMASPAWQVCSGEDIMTSPSEIKQQSLNIRRLLLNWERTSCSDVRDRIFALKVIEYVEDSKESLITVNYAMSKKVLW